MGRLWMIVGSLFTAAALAFGTYSIVNQVAHEEVLETATFSADGVTQVRLHNENGRVEIVGDDVDEISLVAEVSHGLRRTVTHADLEGDTLVVDMDCPTGIPVWCSVDYRLVVPKDLAIDVRNENGRLTLRDLDGDVDAHGDNGTIELARLSGDVDVETENGSVRAGGLTAAEVHARSRHGSVRLTFAEPPTTVTARTSDGSVEVVVPDDDATYRVEADVRGFGGDADAAVRTDPGSDRSITATTNHGSVTVRYPTG
jgi:hypothetical protein